LDELNSKSESRHYSKQLGMSGSRGRVMNGQAIRLSPTDSKVWWDSDKASEVINNARKAWASPFSDADVTPHDAAFPKSRSARHTVYVRYDCPSE